MAPESSPPYAARSTFRGISAVTARKRHPHCRSHRRQWLRNHLHLTQPVLLSAELVRSQPVRARRIVGHIDADGSGIISTLRSRSTFRGISAVTARKRHPLCRSHRPHRRRWLRNHLHLTQPVDSASSSPVNQLVSRLVELTSDIQRQFHFPQIVAIYAQQVSYLIPEYVWWANSFYDTY